MAGILGTMAGFSGFVSIFVLAGTFAFSILQRKREIGLLRSIGMTPWQIRRMIAGEALLLALAGSLLAIPIGIGIAELIAVAMSHFDLAPAGFHPSINIWSFLIAIGSSIGISIGISIGVICMVPIRQGLMGNLSALTLPPVELIAIVLVSTLIVLAAHLLPARYALSANPIENVGLKQ